MTLATRCPTCATVFRVVQDQLKISEGWVRCGRCSEVFNAMEGLFDLDRDVSARMREPSEPSAAEARAAPPQAHPAQVVKIDSQLMGLGEREHSHAPAISARDRLEFPDAQFDTEMADEELVPPAAEPSPAAETDERSAAAAAAEEPTPEFVRQAQRQARWRSPRSRVLMGAIAALLVVVLGLQLMHHERDRLASQAPWFAPVLQAWCAALACTIELPRRIDDVSVESTALTRAGAPDAFKLAVALRNRGANPVAVPSIDLSLTDPNGQLVARRMLAPHEFTPASTALRPGADALLELTLVAGGARVTGYTVEVFYP
ncbi:MAG TPA: zinc-ribbon and DUF3426 domain-containing protein [Burkholderiaceae bacterium]|nr:zinc-ribbon and DUF3426 domain-containing protein [Burkholderiaceae bacterium]